MTRNEEKFRQMADRFGMKFYGAEEMKRDMARKTAQKVVAFGAYVGEDVACELSKSAGNTEDQFFEEFMLKLDDNELDILATYLWDNVPEYRKYDAVVYQQYGNISGMSDSAVTLYFFKKEPEEVKEVAYLVRASETEINQLLVG